MNGRLFVQGSFISLRDQKEKGDFKNVTMFNAVRLFSEKGGDAIDIL